MENCKLKDYEGDYEFFLEKNEGEADVMAEKEAKKKELEKSQIKAKSKARAHVACSRGMVCCVTQLPLQQSRRATLLDPHTSQVTLCGRGKLTLEVPAIAQMSKAEKAMQKKDKAKAFTAKKNAGAAVKNAKRWG